MPFATARLVLGKYGLDLRTPSDREGLLKLINARFQDEDTLERRPGHVARYLRDNSGMTSIPGPVTPAGWVYGHGTKISNLVVSAWEDAHYPWHQQNLFTFRDHDNDISWTGDRLLVHRTNDDRCTGASTFWSRYASLTEPPLHYGIPAYLPAMDDTVRAGIPGTNASDTCLSTTQRCLVWTTATKVYGRIEDRFTGGLIDQTELSGTSGAPTAIRCVVSGGNFVVFWTDSGTGNLHKNYYNGVWQSAVSEVATVVDWDLQPRGFEGFHLIYRTGSTIKARNYAGVTVQGGPYAGDTTVDTTGTTPSGAVAMTVGKDGGYGVAWQQNATANNVRVRTYSAAFAPISAVQTLVAGTATGGLTVAAHDLKDSNGRINYTAYAGLGGTTGCAFQSFNDAGLNGTQTTRPNTSIASRAFNIGNEVFVWLLSGNTALKFLMAGYVQPIICGYADRGAAEAPTAGNRLPGVAYDPLFPTSRVTWTRARIGDPTGTPPSYRVIGDIDFLPDPCAVAYGDSTYLSGSAVQNFDGEAVSDAGFQEYPIASSSNMDASGSLTLTTHYSVRCYLVRTNRRGEKFISAAKTSNSLLLSGSNNRIQWTVFGVMSCTDPNCSIEVYRTEGDGSTYYYEQTLKNDQTVASQTFFSSIADGTLRTHKADPYAPIIGGTPVIQSFGATGCRILVAHRDRLWAAGGQVPAGQVSFSKLKDVGFGAGFDDLAGTVTIDIEGRAITSLAGHNEALVVMHPDRLAVMSADGPDNYGRGFFPPPQLLLAPGATSHRGTALARPGIVYWTAAGPHLLGHDGAVVNISTPIQPLALAFTPSGVRANTSRQDVIWFSKSGVALLWDYTGGNSRWAQWTQLPATSASETSISTSDGRLLVATENTFTDGGIRYSYEGSSNWLRGDDLLAGHNYLRKWGLVGDWRGLHDVRMRMFYDGNNLWEEEQIWQPSTDTWLITQPELLGGNAVSTLTPAQLDAQMTPRQRTSHYGTNKRAKRGDCQRFRVEWSDQYPDSDSFVPRQLVFELGMKPGLGRTAINTFTS